MSVLSDIASLAREHYSVDEIKELIALSKDEVKKDEKEPEQKEPEQKEPEQKEPEQKEPEQKEPEEPDYKKLYEESQEKLKKAQNNNVNKQINDTDSKTSEEQVSDILSAFLN